MSEAASSTPDLSRIVSVIMEHPELIEQISSLVSEDKTKTEAEDTAAFDDVKNEPKTESASVSASAHSSGRRSQLLYALKPYLSDKRSRAIDSMLTFGEIFDMMKQGKGR